jgi:hypothetical protein
MRVRGARQSEAVAKAEAERGRSQRRRSAVAHASDAKGPVAGHPEIHDVVAKFGVDDRSEQIRDLFNGGRDPHGRHGFMVSV